MRNFVLLTVPIDPRMEAQVHFTIRYYVHDLKSVTDFNLLARCKQIDELEQINKMLGTPLNCKAIADIVFSNMMTEESNILRTFTAADMRKYKFQQSLPEFKDARKRGQQHLTGALMSSVVLTVILVHIRSRLTSD